MSDAFSDQSFVPPPNLQSEAINQAIEPAAEVEQTRPAPVLHTARSSFYLNQVAPLVAPQLGEPPESMIAVLNSVHPIVSATHTSPARQKAKTMTQFWVAVIGIGVVVLMAVSDQRAKNSPPLPFPNTSRIPRVR